MCACFKYEFMYLAVILKSFFRLNVEILAEFVFRLFESSFSIKFEFFSIMEMVCLFMFRIF